LAWAQDHLVILSGLYGALRPLDRLQPYRLEMGTPLATSRGRDLYAFWGDTLARHLDRRLRGQAQPVVVNLASQEYFRAVDRRALKARVVECVFQEGKAGRWQVVSFFAKRARGLMARYAVRHQLSVPDSLRNFSDEGYAFAAAVSTPDRLVFRRQASA
ncbi:MAG: peroxide stress protein YaaA, partial [Rubrivivax sp.]|nr:peroxide stress protein YaaA [Rubrivivax sp.]